MFILLFLTVLIIDDLLRDDKDGECDYCHGRPISDYYGMPCPVCKKIAKC